MTTGRQPSLTSMSDCNTSGCCCFNRHGRRSIAPFPEFHPEYDYIEIRPNRFLRIRHKNLRKNCIEDEGNTEKSATCNYMPSRPSQQNGVIACPEVTPHPYASMETEVHISNITERTTVIGDDIKPSQQSHIHDDAFKNSQSEKYNMTIEDRARTASSVDIKVHRKDAHANQGSQNKFKVHRTVSFDESGISAPKQSHRSPVISGKQKVNQEMGDNGSVIFMIHGVGGSSDVWQSQIDFLESKGYQLVIPDLVGHGFSCAPRDVNAYTFDEIMQDIYAIFDRYSRKHNVIIAHSYGCSFSAVLARYRATRVTKVILISGGSPTPLAPQPGLFEMPVCVLSCCSPVIQRGFKRSAFHDAKDSDVFKRQIPFHHAFDVPTYVLKYTMNGQTWPEGDLEFHSNINTATMIIHGKEDGLISLQDETEMADAIFGAHIVVVEGASHMVMMEKPQEVNKHIYDFLLQGLRIEGSGIPRGSGDARQSLAHSTLSLKSVKSIPNSENLMSSSLK